MMGERMVGPAGQLSGQLLNDRYQVGTLLQSTAPQARRARTCCYEALDRKTGHQVFVKAVDFRHEDAASDPLWLEKMVRGLNNEIAIAELCKGLSRVARIIDKFKVTLGRDAIHCLVFVHEGESAHHLTGLIPRLRVLHGITAGLRQLHGRRVAHHDAAFRNTLIADSGRIRVCDFSAATCRDLSSPPHDEEGVIGAIHVAPPEAFYGYLHPDWQVRHFAYDCYTIGSLLFSIFQHEGMAAEADGHGASLFFWIMVGLEDHETPELWEGTNYGDLIPSLRERMVIAITEGISAPSEDIKRDVKVVLRTLCDPDPLRRGVGFADLRGGHRYSLERYLSFMDRLQYRCKIELRRQRQLSVA